MDLVSSEVSDGMDLRAVPVRLDGGLERRIMDGELLLYQPETMTLCALNETAQYIWERCDGRHTVGEIVVGLAERFAAEPEEIGRDVTNILTQLRGLRLVSLLPPSNRDRLEDAEP